MREKSSNIGREISLNRSFKILLKITSFNFYSDAPGTIYKVTLLCVCLSLTRQAIDLNTCKLLRLGTSDKTKK